MPIKMGRHCPQNKKRSDMLINGFMRHCKGPGNFNWFPSELVQLIFDLYYLNHGEWLNQNITIQIVDPDQRNGLDVHLGACHRGYGSMSIPRLTVTHSPMLFIDRDVKSPIWRMYPHHEGGGFMVRPANPFEAENVKEFTRFLGIPREGDPPFDALRDASYAGVLQLVQVNDCENDEFHIQNMDDGRYLTVQCGHGGSCTYTLRLRSVCFQDDPLKATLFRFKTYHHRLERWRKRLTVNSNVLYRERDYWGTRTWIKGHVVGTRHSGFGTEMKVKYSGYSGDDYDDFEDKVKWISGGRWIPIESDLISVQNLNGIEHTVLRAYDLCADNFRTHREKVEWKLAVGALSGEIGDDRDGIMCRDGGNRYKQRVTSERRRKMEKKNKKKKNRKRIHRDWNGKDDDKRIERKSRKYGLIRKYQVHL